MSDPGRAVAIVPVRLGSQRLPGKALLADSGKPLFAHTWEQAQAAQRFDQAIIATDSDEVAAAAEAIGAPVMRTSESPRTGSERCAEAAVQLDASIIVDVQGDWPEVAPGDLDRLVDAVMAGAPCATLVAPLPADRTDDPNVVKAVRGLQGRALYFSRAAVPYLADPAGAPGTRLRHVGVYAFARDTLLRVPELPSSGLAEAEGLEQLRFLENGIAIEALDASNEPWGIESARDYAAFLARLKQGGQPAP
ncbi:MAG: 3-deoxy-manno-octulosonate cytidylyltransferase [Planctomycetota bacterium]